MSKIKILIADDHPLVRDGIKSLFNNVHDIKMVGEAENGEEALKKVKKLLPDILLTDISMPKQSGIDIAAVIKKDFPDTKTIMLSMHEDNEYIKKSIESGAKGYLSKNADKEELLLAIRTVAKGGNYFSHDVSSIMTEQLNDTSSQLHLTSREKEVLKLVIEGEKSKQIADELFVSVHTVETHRTNIMHKLNVKNTAELVKYAINNKLV